MGGVADRLEAMSPERRRYTLETLPQHLHEAGQHARLRKVVMEQDWFEAQRARDRSNRSYAVGLDLAIEASEADETGVPELLVLSLLRATLNTLAAKLPVAALETMTRTGTPDQALFYATQRTDPRARCEALCSVAMAEVQRGDLTGAAKALQRAKEAVPAIADPADRIESLCAVAMVTARTNRVLRSAVQVLEQAAELVGSISDKRRQTHAQANIATVARVLGATDLWQQATTAIEVAYRQAWQTTAQTRRALLSGNIRTFGSAKRATWDVALFARDFDLLARPEYLVTLAAWDQTRSSLLMDVYDEIPAVVLRAAAVHDDRAMADAIVERSLAEQSRQAMLRKIRTSPAFIEALAETGYVEAAIVLISHYLRDDPDAARLREALARGAGKRGDVEAIERAAGPIEPAGKAADWGDRLWRLGAGLGHAAKKAGYRTLGAGDVERLEVLLAGYETLARYHPAKAEVLWKRVAAEGGRRWRQLVQERMEQGEPEKRTELRYLDRLSAIARWMPSGDSGLEDIWQDAIETLVFAGNFERALEIAGRIGNADAQSKALETIAGGMLERRQIRQALQIAGRIPNSVTRQRVIDAAAESTDGLAKERASAIVSQLATQSGRLDAKETLAYSPAFPALMDVYLQCVPVRQGLALIETLGQQANLAAFPALSKAALQQGAGHLAGDLVALIEEQDPSPAGVEALAAAATIWAGNDTFARAAKRAFRLAVECQKRLTIHEVVEALPALARAARALADRAALQRLFGQAKDYRKKEPDILQYQAPPAIDRALVEIAAGLTATGDALKQDYIVDLPALQAIQVGHYKALAMAEMAEALGSVPARQLYRSRPSRLLGLTEALIEEKVLARFDDEEVPDAGDKPLWQREGEMELQTMATALLDNALRILPRVARPSRLLSVPERTNMMQESPPTPALSAAGAFCRLIAIYSRHSRYDDLPRVVQATPYWSDRPVVVASAVKELAAAGRMAEARSLIDMLRNDREKGAARVYLTVSSEGQQMETVWKQALAAGWNEPTLLAITRSLAGDQDRERRWRMVRELLRAGRDRGRAGVLAAIAALAPACAGLTRPEAWRATVEQLVATEGWWQ